MKTEERICQIVAASMGVDISGITLQTRFVEELGCDSLDMIEMAIEVEDAFEVSIEDDHARTFTTVADLVNYVGTLEAHRAQAVS